MSEKDIRETLRVLDELNEFDDMTREAIYGELEKPPDVVVLLRELRGKANWAGRVGDLGEAITDVNIQVAGSLSKQVYQRVADDIEQKFGVCLTDDDGWKYTDAD